MQQKPVDLPVMKKCSKCKEVKPVTDFHKSLSKGSLKPNCKECRVLYHKKYYEANSEKIKANTKKYREENSEKIKKYREENSEKFKPYHKKYYEEHSEEIRVNVVENGMYR